MCGMSGVYSAPFSSVEVGLLYRLAVLNTFRGTDSFGMWDYIPSKPGDSQTIYWKRPDHPFDFLSSDFGEVAKKRWKDNMPRLVATHCRAATQGKISEKNTHPFVFSDIIGMHNGTVTGDFDNRKKFGTDSEAIFYNINKMGLADGLKALHGTQPAFALVWMDFEKKTMNFIRNTKRSLYWAGCYGGSTLAWSSDDAHLKSAMNHLYNPQMAGAFKPYVHYSFDYTKGGTAEVVEIPIKEAEEPAPKNYSHIPANDWNRGSANKPKEWTVAEWEGFGKDAGDSSINWELYTEWDEPTQQFFTEYAYKELLVLRIAEAKKAVDNIVKLPPSNTTMDSDPMNDPLPWENDRPGEEAEEEFFPFGVGGNKFCSAKSLKRKLATGCLVTGNVSDFEEFVFWISDDEYICWEAAEDLVTDPNHWLIRGGGASLDTVERIRSEFQEIVGKRAEKEEEEEEADDDDEDVQNSLDVDRYVKEQLRRVH